MRTVSSKERFRKGHVRAHESAKRTVICHIGAKPSSKQSESRTIATGEGDNHIPSRSNSWVDYVLVHRGHQYLATETEKLDYFSGTLGID